MLLFSTAALGQLARALVEGARPEADQEEDIRAIAPASESSIGGVTSRSTAVAVAVFERCASESSSTRVKSKPINVQEQEKVEADRRSIGLSSLLSPEAVLCAIRVSLCIHSCVSVGRCATCST
eukprot:IDg5528t1